VWTVHLSQNVEDDGLGTWEPLDERGHRGGDVHGSPGWCNRPHQPGANPRRQRHRDVWRSGGHGERLEAATCPCGPREPYDGGPGGYELAGRSFVTLTLKSAAYRPVDIGAWLNVADLARSPVG
jgi:hypothetical protein